MKCCRTWRSTSQTQVSLGNGVRSEIVLGSLVSANYFDALGIKPALGRTFLPEEDRTPGAHPVVVLTTVFGEVVSTVIRSWSVRRLF